MAYNPKDTKTGAITTRKGKVNYKKYVHKFMFFDMYRVFNAVYSQPTGAAGDRRVHWLFIQQIATQKLQYWKMYSPNRTFDDSPENFWMIEYATTLYKNFWQAFSWILGRMGLPEPVVEIIKWIINSINRELKIPFQI